MRKAFWLWIGLVLVTSARPSSAFDPLQRAERAAREAQRALAAGDTAAAVEGMLQAQALAPDDPRIRSGLAETFYDSGEYQAAQRQFEPLADPQAPLPQRRRALYNAGNAAFEQQDYESALDYYTTALLEGEGEPPADLLHNLELAQLLQQQQEQQRQESEESGEDGEPQEGEDSQPNDEQQQEQQEQPGEQEQPPEGEPEQEPQEQESPPDSTGQQPPPPEPQDAPTDSLDAPVPPPDIDRMTPEEAMRLLEALDYDEQQLRESIQRRLRGDDEEDEHDW